MKTFILFLIFIIVIGVVYFIYNSNAYGFSVEVDGNLLKGLNSTAEYSGGRLSIFTMLKDPAKKRIIILINASKPGTHVLNSEAGPFYGKGNRAEYHYGSNNNLALFITSGRNAGKCEITTLDVNNKKVSGTFEFEAVEFNNSGNGYGFGTRVVHITNGVFENVRIK